MTSRPLQILVIGPAWIGDMVMAQTLFKLLLIQNNTALIDVLAPAWTLPVLERMPEVRSILLLPFTHGQLKLKKRYSFAKQLRSKKYDHVIVLPNSFKSALIALWSRIPKRTGWLGEWRWGLLNDIRYKKKTKFPLMIQQFMALGLPNNEQLPSILESFYPTLVVNEQQRLATLQKLNLHLSQPILALCPGAEYGPAKRWPTQYFAKVANTFLSNNWQVWIFGSQGDAEISNEIMEQTNNKCVNLSGHTTLTEAIDLLSVANATVSNDSGLMHIAAALNRPLIVLYGSSSPAFTPPLTKKVILLNLQLACSPCFERECPLKHFDCMKKILPETVISKLNELIS